jgi:hypothetical protein
MSGLETMLLNLRESGFMLILLWLLTLSIVYGILSHIKMPQSLPARGVIAIVSAFMVLLAAAAGAVATFISNLITASVMIAFGIMIVMIFIEISGTKMGGEHVFSKHPRWVVATLVLLLVLVFIGAGGLGLLNIPSIVISDPMLAMAFFLIVMAVAVWVMFKGTEGGK